jgi:hypothetical protein
MSKADGAKTGEFENPFLSPDKEMVEPGDGK